MLIKILINLIKKYSKNSNIVKYVIYLIYVTFSVKTQLKSFLFISYFLHNIILHIVKNILWKYFLGIFNID